MNAKMFAAAAGHGVDAALWLPLLQEAATRFNIAGNEAESAFLANAAHESGEFTTFVEGLNYAYTALLGQWPTHFNIQQALQYGRVDPKHLVKGVKPGTIATAANNEKPELVNGVTIKGKFFPVERHAADQVQIANLAYGGRYGNNAPGDGWKHRGRGIFQLTFKANYQAYADAIKDQSVMANPDLVSLPKHAAMSAAWYWSHRNLSKVLATKGFDAVCVAINGGTIGLAERNDNFKELIALA